MNEKVIAIPGNQEKSTWLKDYFDVNPWFIFLLCCISFLLTLYIRNTVIITDAIYYNTFVEKIAYDQIDNMIQIRKDHMWLGYIFDLLIIPIQLFFVAMCLNVGTLLMQWRVKFTQLFALSTKAFIVFAFQRIFQSLYLLHTPVETFEDLVNANLFSLQRWLDFTEIPGWLSYPLGIINLFELLFFLLLAFGLTMLVPKDFKSSLKFVGLTYGIGLFIWMCVVAFLYLNLSNTSG